MIKIFFIGYNNTGTTSLQHFFETSNLNFKMELDSPFTGCYPKIIFPEYKCNIDKDKWYQRTFKIIEEKDIIHINEPNEEIIKKIVNKYPNDIYIYIK